MVADLAVAATAYSVANALGASPKVMLSLFEAGIVESGFRNLAYGDRDSVGFLQQRPSQGWPDPMNVETATRSYVERAKKNEASYPTAGKLAQSVQRSAFPDRYDDAEDEARALLDRVRAGGQGVPATPAPGGGGLADAGGGLVDAVQSGAAALKTMAGSAVNVGGLATQLMKLALPSNVVRAAAGGVGIIMIFIGIIMIGKAAK